MPLTLLPLTDEAGKLIAPEWLPRLLPVHRQLREKLPSEADAYHARLAAVFASGGRLTLAVDGETVKGLALWRILENTYEGRRLYVDDLVTDAACRSQGVGKALIGWLEAAARQHSCAVLALDSGTQRTQAHRFYFREGFVIPSFCFRKTLV
ncbi:MAG: GNAT family N-acetyltransferase [Zoogloeaceae bacterium]|jgi:GNAT superfamily N-acetyltransferase|nr:GNAT family N-acetyltransferase [Zoogloeaceae bacterium]